MDIAFNAHKQTLDVLLGQYKSFHNIVENTPEFNLTYDLSTDDTDLYTRSIYRHPRSLHGAIGCVTEAAELLDAHKKMIFGKNKPLSEGNIKEECGDLFFYLFLVMDAHGITLKDVIADNVVKLANRYIEKFNV